MPALKEVKGRIATVQTTRKITQARGVVSSALLIRSQAMLSHARAYLDALAALPIPPAGESPLNHSQNKTAPRAIIVAAGAGGMCGAFNSHMERELAQLVASVPGEKLIYPLGQKMRDASRRMGLRAAGEFDALAGKPAYEQAAALAAALIGDFTAGRISGVDMLWYDFRSMGRHEIVRSALLPLPAQSAAEASQKISPTGAKKEPAPLPNADNIIVEPSAAMVAQAVLPLLVNARLWQNVISTAACEHAARIIAMRGATDNADKLLTELQLTYNKLRQQNITSELLDIVGSSFA